MTEAEWLACEDPRRLLQVLRNRGGGGRKHRLLAVACCRRIWHLLAHDHLHEAVETAEKYADGLANEEERTFAGDNARRVSDEWRETLPGEWSRGGYLRACKAALNALLGFDPHISAFTALDESARAEGIEKLVKVGIDDGAIPEPQLAELQGLLMQARLPYLAPIRDIFGNPFRPVTVSPNWLTPTVKQLAEAIYETRDFTSLPILADALEDAACTNQDILNHLRQPGEHVEGCWPLDLVLGKG